MPKQLNEQETYVRNVGFDLKVSYNSDGRQEYVGMAYPNKATSDEEWQIYKLEYDSDGRIITRRYANGNDKFDKIWDSRDTAYTYVDIS